MALGALAILTLAWIVVSWYRRRGGAGCRGPKPRLWRLALPWTWVLERGCGYDLSGLRADAAGEVRCPECGTASKPGRRRRGRGAWWVFGRLCIPAVLLMASIGAWHVRYIRSCAWAKGMPTPVLIVLERRVPGLLTDAVRGELEARQETGKIGRRWAGWLRSLAIRSLGDDEVDWNAQWGCRVLWHDIVGSVPALEAALDDPDWQRRQVAASILRDWEYHTRCGSGKESLAGDMEAYEPGGALYRVSVEGLRDDSLPRDGRRERTTWIANAKESLFFLVRHAEGAKPELLEALTSDDEQQRFLAAAALGLGRTEGVAGDVAPILLSHLKRNRWQGDGTTAASALFGLGPEAIRYIEPHLGDPDEQLAASAELLVRRLRGEPLTDSEAKRLNVLTVTRIDPTQGGNLWEALRLP